MMIDLSIFHRCLTILSSLVGRQLEIQTDKHISIAFICRLLILRIVQAFENSNNQKRFIPAVGVSIFIIYCYWTHWETILSGYKNKSGLMAKKNIPNGVDPWKW
ncbi:PDF receptor [Trichinella spiralis]|uniref:PDF receptor n=1 Tax=Trichinella spiralis TaxID=6334 RepID=A0ABR3K381_TRISP